MNSATGGAVATPKITGAISRSQQLLKFAAASSCENSLELSKF